MATLLDLFWFGRPGTDECDEFHGQVKYCHADEHTGDSVDKYAYR
jgi:hypothetical protein